MHAPAGRPAPAGPIGFGAGAAVRCGPAGRGRRPRGTPSPPRPPRPARLKKAAGRSPGCSNTTPAGGGTWTLIYDLDPPPTDRFGGMLTLADPAGRLVGWEDEHLVVELRGAPDPAAGADARGLPRYRVAAATPTGIYEP